MLGGADQLVMGITLHSRFFIESASALTIHERSGGSVLKMVGEP